MNGDVYVARRIAAASAAAAVMGLAAFLMGARMGSVLLALVGFVLLGISTGWAAKAST